MGKIIKTDVEIEQTFIRAPNNMYTFSSKKVREWVISNCGKDTLNLYAGKTKLDINETRNDVNPEMPADYHMPAFDFLRLWKGRKFDTVILDPPYSERKAIEFYKGYRASNFNKTKDAIINILKPLGVVISCGYQSVVMGKKRNFYIQKLAHISHGGAIHDTTITVERFIPDAF